jgi:peptidoglycan hydrolase-like protein with peptidoglycan-binding domain
MKRVLIAAAALIWLLAPSARAQDGSVYIQIQARPTLQAAEESARQFAQIFEDVAGFSLGNGWYGVALGPYPRPVAEAELQRLRALGAVPRDSFLQAAGQYGAQFWPVGAPTFTAPAPALPAAPQPERRSDETVAEARASEAALSRAAREELQIALAWAGYYSAAIDGAFGRGTRGAMAAWQADQGYTATGVLTTRQRTALLGQYNSVFDGLGMAVLDDPDLGLSLEMPLGAVALDRVEPPFAVFDPIGALPVRVLLISQPGDRRTLGGLYEIMQTLEIVPLDGERRLSANGFTLTGRNARVVSHTEVTLENGAIKGFTLVWPAGDEERRSRVLARMQASLAMLPGVLDPGAGTGGGESVDLISGLEIRQPAATASGFFVDADGTVLTSAAAVETCTRVTLDEITEASVIARDTVLGLAVLEPAEPLSPRRTAAFGDAPARLRAEIAVAGYPFGGTLGAPTLTFGTLEDLRGLSGEAGVNRLALAPLPGDAGGPVLDAAGSVLGMLLPASGESGRVLPEGVSFAAEKSAILDFLARAGVEAAPQPRGAILDPEDLSRLAADMTVLVSCWD